MTLDDMIATCRYCRHSISRSPGQLWVDATGWEICPKTGPHEPIPAGQPGGPLAVPGNPLEPDPRLWGEPR